MSLPEGTEALQPQPPVRRSNVWRWVLMIGGVLIGFPFCCCGGLLIYSTTVKDFKLANGQHLGGSPMNVRFDYEIVNDGMLHDAYFIVVRTADGISRERNLQGSYAKRGMMNFHALDVGPPNQSQSPVKVWIEKEDIRGGRSRASNVLKIHAKVT